jgi:hypothetical protein
MYRYIVIFIFSKIFPASAYTKKPVKHPVEYGNVSPQGDGDSQRDFLHKEVEPIQKWFHLMQRCIEQGPFSRGYD